MVAKEAFAILGYGTCSSLMLIMNKVAVHLLPAPSLVLLCQFMASWIAVKLCGLCGCIVVDELEWKKVKQFWMVSVAFLACVYVFLHLRACACGLCPCLHACVHVHVHKCKRAA